MNGLRPNAARILLLSISLTVIAWSLTPLDVAAWPSAAEESAGSTRKSARESPAAEEKSGAPNELDSQLLEGLEGLGDEPGKPVQRAGQGGESSEPRKTAPESDSSAERVDPDHAGSDIGQRHPLRPVQEEMEQAAELLQQRSLNGETRQVQERIVTRLDRLIAELGGSPQSQPQAKRQEREKAEGSVKKSSELSGNQAARKVGDPAAKNKQTELEEAAALQRAVGEVWGHLPERVRRQMRSAAGVEFLPQYRRLIEAYYRRLAEEDVRPEQ